MVHLKKVDIKHIMFSKKEIIAFFAALAFNVFLIIAFNDRNCTYFMLLRFGVLLMEFCIWSEKTLLKSVSNVEQRALCDIWERNLLAKRIFEN